jgi:hypothetical protein
MRLLLILVVFLTSCNLIDPVPSGRIRIKNDSQDKKFNMLQVSGGGAYFSLKPGEAKLLPAGTSSFSLRRDYQDHAREYSVSCADFGSDDSGITVKMIDVHTNRIAGGCKTTSANKF